MTELNGALLISSSTSIWCGMDGHGQGSFVAGSSSRTVVFDSTGRHAPLSPRLGSDPILCQPLPPASKLAEEGIAQSELELNRQQLARIRERELAEALQDQQWEIERQAYKAESGGSQASRKGKGKDAGGAGKGGETKAFVRPPQAYELYQAIDKKDIDFIMRVRDHAFPLLLQKNAGEFPILYAARIGESHRDVVILLVGAMSRYVNHLDEEDFEKKGTRDILKMLRSNLKLAIDNALLPGHNPALLSSYLQVLIMSEGDTWVHKAVYEVSLLLRDPSATPVKAAEAMVRSFCTKELRGAPGGIGDVEEYIANAALDLVIMAAWSLATNQISADPLPTHTFARDLRTWTMLREAMEENRSSLGKLGTRQRKLLETLLELGGESKKGVQGRLRDVANALDGKG